MITVSDFLKILDTKNTTVLFFNFKKQKIGSIQNGKRENVPYENRIAWVCVNGNENILLVTIK